MPFHFPLTQNIANGIFSTSREPNSPAAENAEIGDCGVDVVPRKNGRHAQYCEVGD